MSLIKEASLDTTAYIVLVNNTIHSVCASREVADQIAADTKNSVVQTFPVITSYQPQAASMTESATKVVTFGDYVEQLEQDHPTGVPTLKDMFKTRKKLADTSHTVNAIEQDPVTSAFKIITKLIPVKQ